MISWIKSSSGSWRFVLVIVGLSFAGGWLLGTNKTVSQPVAVETTVTHDVKTEQVDKVKHVVIVTETKKPDGTVVKKTEVREEKAKEISKRDDVLKVVDVKENKSKYSLGVQYLPSLTQAPSARDIAVEVAARLGGSNVWVTGGLDVKHVQLSIGARYEW